MAIFSRRQTEERLEETRRLQASQERMSEEIEDLMKEASGLESDNAMPVRLKLDKARQLQTVIEDTSGQSMAAFTSLSNSVATYVKKEDLPNLENMQK